MLHRRLKVRRLKNARAGLAAIEYVLIASLIVVGLVMSVWTIGQATEKTYTQVVSSLDTTLKDSPSDCVGPVVADSRGIPHNPCRSQPHVKEA